MKKVIPLFPTTSRIDELKQLLSDAQNIETMPSKTDKLEAIFLQLVKIEKLLKKMPPQMSYRNKLAFNTFKLLI